MRRGDPLSFDRDRGRRGAGGENSILQRASHDVIFDASNTSGKPRPSRDVVLIFDGSSSMNCTASGAVPVVGAAVNDATGAGGGASVTVMVFVLLVEPPALVAVNVAV